MGKPSKANKKGNAGSAKGKTSVDLAERYFKGMKGSVGKKDTTKNQKNKTNKLDPKSKKFDTDTKLLKKIQDKKEKRNMSKLKRKREKELKEEMEEQEPPVPVELKKPKITDDAKNILLSEIDFPEVSVADSLPTIYEKMTKLQAAVIPPLCTYQLHHIQHLVTLILTPY